MVFAGKLISILGTKAGGNLSEEGADVNPVTIVFPMDIEA